MSLKTISDSLEALSDGHQAKKLRVHHRCLRGIRGVAPGEVARVAAAAWAKKPTQLPEHTEALNQLFGSALEDGLVAIAMLAPLAPASPAECLAIAQRWARQVDDAMTADALGWALIGPCLLVQPDLYEQVHELHSHHRSWTRRVMLMAAMAALPTPLEGTAAACLRQAMDTSVVQFVDNPVPSILEPLLNASLRDDAPPVQKALRRVVGAWASVAPEEAEYWADTRPGGIPKMIRSELEKQCKKAQRRLAKG